MRDLQINYSRALVIRSHACDIVALDIEDLSGPATKVYDYTYLYECEFDLFMKNTSFVTDQPVQIRFAMGYIELPTNDRLRNEYYVLYALAVDFVGDKVYALTTYNDIWQSHKLIIVDMLGKYYSIALTDLDMPSQIVVDPAVGLLFIAQRSSVSKQKFNMSFNDLDITNIRT